MRKYILIFSGTYSFAFVAAIVLSAMFALDGSFTVATLMAGAMITSMLFVKDHKRSPNKTEKRTLVWGSLLSSILISSIAAAIFLALSAERSSIIEVLTPIPLWMWILSVVVISVIYAAFLSFCYGWLTEKLFVRRDA